MKISKIKIVAIAGVVLVLLFTSACVLGPPLVNIISVAANRGFFIPKESSFFTFRILEMNQGSGEWWIFGEDRNNYYFYGDNEYREGYMIFPKSKTSFCKSFDKLDYSTWCKEYSIHAKTPLK